LGALAGGAATAAPIYAAPKILTCSGGDFATQTFTTIPSGTYAKIKVTGACNVAPNAVIRVLGNINVTAGAAFDAQSAPAKITVDGDVNAAAGAIVGLGCLPNPTGHTTGHPCTVEPNRHSTISVHGHITAFDADTMLLNGIRVRGNVTLIGGGEDMIPWTVKDNKIGRSLLIAGVTPNWLGVILNEVGGNVTLTNITITDPGDPTPTIFIASNKVGRNLSCWGLGPNVSGGFPGEVNVVGGQTFGQCVNLPIATG
jgi:hypothetical protein